MPKSKTYFVSIAGRVPINYEVRVKAKNEKEAYEKALEAHDNDEGEWAEEPIWDEAELNIDENDLDPAFNDGKIPVGVYIEEE